MMNRKIALSVNTAWNVYNFRSGLVKALLDHDYQVTVMAPPDEYVPRLTGMGCRFIGLPMDSNGAHPGRDISLLMRYVRILRSERPLVYLGYTVKPNVYGSLAAQALGIPVVNNIAGLGTTFINKSPLTYLVRELYRLSLHRSRRVFFQNAQDQHLFIQSGLVQQKIADRLPGSGINLAHYLPVPLPPTSAPALCFLLIARMLKDKGVEEFVAAAKIVRRHVPTAQFQLLGFIDEKNANSIPREKIRSWENEGLVQYLGETDDVRPSLARADCIVLPSYREGVPRSLLEAAAMARPIIATNVAGCRDIVDDGVNGLLCQPRDPGDLAQKMMEMIRLPAQARVEMGQAGRRKVHAHFDENLVVRKYLEVIEDIATRSERSRNIGKAIPRAHVRQG